MGFMMRGCRRRCRIVAANVPDDTRARLGVVGPVHRIVLVTRRRTQGLTISAFRFSDYGRNLSQLVSVLVKSREYWRGQGDARRYLVTRAQVEQALERHAAKLVHIANPAQARALRAAVASARVPNGQS